MNNLIATISSILSEEAYTAPKIKTFKIDGETFQTIAPNAYAELKLSDDSNVKIEYVDRRKQSMGVNVVNIRTDQKNNYLPSSELSPMEFRNISSYVHEEI